MEHYLPKIMDNTITVYLIFWLKPMTVHREKRIRRKPEE